jgi:hypothetical protein
VTQNPLFDVVVVGAGLGYVMAVPIAIDKTM